jgi:predicted TIM-barrel fold metal-dependent hydrolase
VIDVSVLVGASPRQVPASAYGMAAAMPELRSHGVAAALVAARSHRHEIGNDIALAAAARSEGVRLYPVATINPVQYLDWPTELERVLAAGAIGVRFFPDAQGWSVDSEVFRAIATAVRGRCPLFIAVTHFGDATAIGAATQRLDAPVILCGGHYTQLGDCLAALLRWPHLYLETSRLAQFRGVETVVRSVGAHRLLFGSGAPARPIQATLNAVLTAEISDADRRAILAGNASHVFGVPNVAFDLPSPTTTSDLIDVHAHIGTLGFPTPAVDPSEYGAVVARHGIVKSIASSLRAIAGDLDTGNSEAFNVKGDALHAYVVVDPNDLDASCQAMDDAYRRGAAIGAKLHCGWSGQATTSRACLTLLREIARRGRPLKIHVDGPDWAEALACVAADYPAWKVIVAHAGPGSPSREAASLVERTQNVYVELATSFPDLPVVREVVRRVGPDRLAFGSDSPLLDAAYVQGIYADAGADLGRTIDVARQVFDV